MVALTPRCALELGYEVSVEDQGKAYIEVSGRKGFGVKADDLLDDLVSAQLIDVDAAGGGLDSQYRFHDLIRVFARERLAAEEPTATGDSGRPRAS